MNLFIASLVIFLSFFYIPISTNNLSIIAIDNNGIATYYTVEGNAEDEINAAIESLTMGGTVHLSEGYFPITASGTDYIRNHQSNVELIGSGINTILAGQPGGNNVVVELLALEGEHVENVGISNLSITTEEGCYANGAGIGTIDSTSTLKNAYASDLWIHDINWQSGIGGGKGMTMGSFAVGTVDGVNLSNIEVWGCEFYGIDTTHNYVNGGIKNLSMSNINISGSVKHNLFVLGVDNVTVSGMRASNSITGNGAIFDWCNNVSIGGLMATGNTARGLLMGQTHSLTTNQTYISRNGTSGIDIDDCTDICLTRTKIIYNEIGVDVDNSDVTLISCTVKWNVLDFRYINMN